MSPEEIKLIYFFNEPSAPSKIIPEYLDYSEQDERYSDRKDESTIHNGAYAQNNDLYTMYDAITELEIDTDITDDGFYVPFSISESEVADDGIVQGESSFFTIANTNQTLIEDDFE